MSTIPIIASAADLPGAIRHAERNPQSRWYVAKRAAALGVGERIPADWAITAAAPWMDKKDSDDDESTEKKKCSTEDCDKDAVMFGKCKEHAKKGGKAKKAVAASGIRRLTQRHIDRYNRAMTAAGDFAQLHPRDRKGRFIEKMDLVNVFSTIGGTTVEDRGMATGVRKNPDTGKVEVQVDLDSGAISWVGVDRVESAPAPKATLSNDDRKAKHFAQMNAGFDALKKAGVKVDGTMPGPDGGYLPETKENSSSIEDKIRGLSDDEIQSIIYYGDYLERLGDGRRESSSVAARNVQASRSRESEPLSQVKRPMTSRDYAKADAAARTMSGRDILKAAKAARNDPPPSPRRSGLRPSGMSDEQLIAAIANAPEGSKWYNALVAEAKGRKGARGMTAAGPVGDWDGDLHPRDRKGRFIEKLDLINVFSVIGGTQVQFQGVAVGNGKGPDGDYVEVRHDSGAGVQITRIPVKRIESSPPAKATLGPKGGEKADNAEKMFGTDSPQHQKAKESLANDESGWPGPVTIGPDDAVYRHPQGSAIVVTDGGVVTKYRPDGKKAKTSATAEKLAQGHGGWEYTGDGQDGIDGWVEKSGGGAVTPADVAPDGKDLDPGFVDAANAAPKSIVKRPADHADAANPTGSTGAPKEVRPGMSAYDRKGRKIFVNDETDDGVFIVQRDGVSAEYEIPKSEVTAEKPEPQGPGPVKEVDPQGGPRPLTTEQKLQKGIVDGSLEELAANVGNNGKPYPPATGTVDDPIDVQGDLRAAAMHLAEGRHIRLNKVDEVGTLLDELATLVNEAKAKGDKAPDINLCQVSMPGTNLFCAEHKGIPRTQMPQLGGQPVPGSRADELPRDKNGEVNIAQAFRDRLGELGIGIEVKDVKANWLKASQMELDGPKVAGMTGAMKEGKVPDAAIFVTRDGYVIDGHHRWASKVALDAEDGELGNLEMPVEMVDMEIGEALAFANAFALDFGIQPKGLGAKAEGTGAPDTKVDTPNEAVGDADLLIDAISQEEFDGKPRGFDAHTQELAALANQAHKSGSQEDRDALADALEESDTQVDPERVAEVVQGLRGDAPAGVPEPDDNGEFDSLEDVRTVAAEMGIDSDEFDRIVSEIDESDYRNTDTDRYSVQGIYNEAVIQRLTDGYSDDQDDFIDEQSAHFMDQGLSVGDAAAEIEAQLDYDEEDGDDESAAGMIEALLDDGDFAEYTPAEITALVESANAEGRTDLGKALDQAYTEAGGYDGDDGEGEETGLAPEILQEYEHKVDTYGYDSDVAQAMRDEHPELAYDTEGGDTGFDTSAELKKAIADPEYKVTIPSDSMSGDEGEHHTELPAVSSIKDGILSAYGDEMPEDDELTPAWAKVLEDLDIPADGEDNSAMEVLIDRVLKALDEARAERDGDGGSGDGEPEGAPPIDLQALDGNVAAIVTSDEDGVRLNTDGVDTYRPVRDLLNVDANDGSWASGMSTYQFDSLLGYSEDWADDPESVPDWAQDKLAGIQKVAEKYGIDDMTDVIEFRRQAMDLGWAQEEQLTAILNGEPFEEQNPNALANLVPFLRGNRLSDVEMDEFGDSDGLTTLRDLGDIIDTYLKGPDGGPSEAAVAEDAAAVELGDTPTGQLGGVSKDDMPDVPADQIPDGITMTPNYGVADVSFGGQVIGAMWQTDDGQWGTPDGDFDTAREALMDLINVRGGDLQAADEENAKMFAAEAKMAGDDEPQSPDITSDESAALGQLGELYTNADGNEVWRIKDPAGNVVAEDVAGDFDAAKIAKEQLDAAPAAGSPTGTADSTGDPAAAATVRLMANSAAKDSVAVSPQEAASRIDAILDLADGGDPDVAQKALAKLMTELKLGGKQRKRYREALDAYTGGNDDSAAVQAEEVAAGLSDSNPVKEKLAAKAAEMKSPPAAEPFVKGTPAPGATHEQLADILKSTGKLPKEVKKVKADPLPNSWWTGKSSQYRVKDNAATSEIVVNGEKIGTIQRGQVGGPIMNGSINVGWASQSTGWLIVNDKDKVIRGSGLTASTVQEAIEILLRDKAKREQAAPAAAAPEVDKPKTFRLGDWTRDSEPGLTEAAMTEMFRVFDDGYFSGGSSDFGSSDVTTDKDGRRVLRVSAGNEYNNAWAVLDANTGEIIKTGVTGAYDEELGPLSPGSLAKMSSIIKTTPKADNDKQTKVEDLPDWVVEMNAGLSPNTNYANLPTYDAARVTAAKVEHKRRIDAMGPYDPSTLDEKSVPELRNTLERLQALRDFGKATQVKAAIMRRSGKA